MRLNRGDTPYTLNPPAEKNAPYIEIASGPTIEPPERGIGPPAGARRHPVPTFKAPFYP